LSKCEISKAIVRNNEVLPDYKKYYTEESKMTHQIHKFYE